MAEVKKDLRKLWFVPHPTSQFKEDVKMLAKTHNLKIRDSRYAEGVAAENVAQQPPKLTLKPVPKPVRR